MGRDAVTVSASRVIVGRLLSGWAAGEPGMEVTFEGDRITMSLPNDRTVTLQPSSRGRHPPIADIAFNVAWPPCFIAIRPVAPHDGLPRSFNPEGLPPGSRAVETRYITLVVDRDIEELRRRIESICQHLSSSFTLITGLHRIVQFDPISERASCSMEVLPHRRHSAPVPYTDATSGRNSPLIDWWPPRRFSELFTMSRSSRGQERASSPVPNVYSTEPEPKPVMLARRSMGRPVTPRRDASVAS